MFQMITKKLINRETVSYVFFGILTTAADWLIYTVLRMKAVDYLSATVFSWLGAVLFAFVTNKLFVFRSFQFKPGYLFREFFSFIACRGATGAFTVLAMVVLVDYLNMNDYVGKFIVSAIVLLLNYVFSKIFIFRKKTCKEE